MRGLSCKANSSDRTRSNASALSLTQCRSAKTGKRPESLEGQIVQDADRLDAIGAIGIARTFAFGGKNGRSIESSLQHFHDKLLLLKDEMNTEEAKRIAEIRHSYMEGFLTEMQEEMTSF